MSMDWWVVFLTTGTRPAESCVGLLQRDRVSPERNTAGSSAPVKWDWLAWGHQPRCQHGCKALVMASTEQWRPWDSTAVLRCVVLAPSGALQSTAALAACSRAIGTEVLPCPGCSRLSSALGGALSLACTAAWSAAAQPLRAAGRQTSARARKWRHLPGWYLHHFSATSQVSMYFFFSLNENVFKWLSWGHKLTVPWYSSRYFNLKYFFTHEINFPYSINNLSLPGVKISILWLILISKIYSTIKKGQRFPLLSWKCF